MQNFPKIETINDVLPAIAGRDEFSVSDRDWGRVICYNYANGTETFPAIGSDPDAEMLRECRGLLFDMDGNILARSMQKFKNVGESDEFQIRNLDLSQPNVILEKVDGSFVRPFYTDRKAKHWRLATKRGITDVGMNAETWVSGQTHYMKLFDWCLHRNLTPIFEWCSLKNQIVVPYPKDDLVLLAIRENISGRHFLYSEMQDLLDSDVQWKNVTLVKAYEGNAKNMQDLVNETRGLIGQEGWVVRFDNGVFAKVKAEDYLNLHRALDGLRFEKEVVRLILTEKMDDVKSLVKADLRQKLDDFELGFWHGLNTYVSEIEQQFASVQHLGKKVFAQQYKDLDPNVRSFLFGAFDGRSILDQVVKLIDKRSLSNVNLATVAHMWRPAEWKSGFMSSDD